MSCSVLSHGALMLMLHNLCFPTETDAAKVVSALRVDRTMLALAHCVFSKPSPPLLRTCWFTSRAQLLKSVQRKSIFTTRLLRAYSSVSCVWKYGQGSEATCSRSLVGSAEVAIATLSSSDFERGKCAIVAFSERFPYVLWPRPAT